MQVADASASKVITFYSYKGGTGRSMSLANVAWIIASNGHTVLTIDWDLEAPGLHRYFAPFLDDPKLADTDGLIDQLYAYLQATSRPPTGDDASSADWISEYADVSRYAEPLTWEFPMGGRIDLLGAGRQDRRYGERVNLFDWQTFYGEYGGAAFFEKLIEQARREYDYILIDSRTGVSDTSGICTVHLPDALAVFYTLNDQSIEGASAVARGARDRRRSVDADLKFRVYPIATRIENAEKEKLRVRLGLARQAFDPVVDFITDDDERDEYFGSMQLQYEPYYAYEEVLATVIDDPTRRGSLLSSFEALTRLLTDDAVQELARVSETRRMEAKTSYEGPKTLEAVSAGPASASPRYDVFVSFGPDDASEAQALIKSLRSICKVFDPSKSLRPGDRIQDVSEAALHSSRLIVAVLSDALTPGQSDELALANHLEKVIVPVWRSKAARGLAMQKIPDLADRQGLFLRGRDDLPVIQRAVGELLGVRTRSPRTENLDVQAGDVRRSVESPSRWRTRAGAALALVLVAALFLQSGLFKGERAASGSAGILVTQAVQARDTDPVLSLLLAREAVRLDRSDFAINALKQSLRSSPELRRFASPSGAAFVFARLHAQSGYLLATDVTGDTYVFESDKTVSDVVYIGRTRAVSWGPVDRAGRPSVLSVLLDGTVARWTPLDGNRRLFDLDNENIEDLSISPTGAHLLALDGKGRLTTYLLNQTDPYEPVDGVRALPNRPWSLDGSSFAAIGFNGEVRIYDAFSGPSLKPGNVIEPLAPAFGVIDVLLNGDGSAALVMAGEATAIYVAGSRLLLRNEAEQQLAAARQVQPPVTTGARVQREEAEPPARFGTPTVGAWSPITVSVEGNRGLTLLEQAAIGFDDGSVIVWRISGDGQTRSLTRFPGRGAGASARNTGSAARPVSNIAFSDTGARFAVSRGSAVDIYRPGADPFSSSPPVTWNGHDGQVNDLQWSRIGDRCVTASQDGTVRVWDPDTGSLELDLPAEELLRLAEARLPRWLTESEADDFYLLYDAPPEPTVYEAIVDKGLQEK